MSDRDICIEQCRIWVNTFIREHSICPFAERVITESELAYHCLDDEDVESVLVEIFFMLRSMHDKDSPETQLVILPAWQNDFEGFLSLCETARAMLDEYAMTSEFQFANFHPDYLFENEALDSASHFTNRSPWPMLHILRQSSISKALQHYPEPETIPERNIALMHKLGKTALAKQLKRIQNQVD